MSIDKERLLLEVKANPALAERLGIGLSDVTDDREVSFQLTANDPEEGMTGRPAHRPYHHVYLRREGSLGKPEQYGAHAWYRIQNGWAAGYLTDRQALHAFLQSGEQLTLEVPS